MQLKMYKEVIKEFAVYPKKNEALYLRLGIYNEVGELLGVFAK